MNTKGAVFAAAVAGLFASAAPVAAFAKGSGKVHCQSANECKGKGSCKSAENSCKGQNECKGKGWTETTAKDCTAKGGTVAKM